MNIGANSNWLANGLGASGGSFITGGGDFVVEGVPITCSQEDVTFTATLNGDMQLNDTLEIWPIPNMPAC